MKRLFGFAMTLAAAIGFAAAAGAQTGGAGGAGASGGAGGAASAGAAGTAGAGASASGTAGVGRAGAPGTVGANTATGNTNGVPVGNNPSSAPARPVEQPGANNGIGVGNNFGSNTRGRFNGVDNSNAAARVGRNNIGPNSDAFSGSASGNIGQTPFFNNPAVRSELKMNDTQFNSLNRAYQNAYGTYNQSVNGLGNNLTPDQRAQRIEQLENGFNDSFNNTVDSTLTDAQSRMRYDQLYRQYQGLNAFNNMAVQSQLNLTPQQRTQIRALSTQWRDQQGANGTPNYSQYSEQLNAILTPQQQQTWSQLTGSRFNFGNTGGVGAGTHTQTGNPRNNLTAPGNGDTVPFGGATNNNSGTSSSTNAGTSGAGTTPAATGGAGGVGSSSSSGTSGSGAGAAGAGSGK